MFVLQLQRIQPALSTMRGEYNVNVPTHLHDWQCEFVLHCMLNVLADYDDHIIQTGSETFAVHSGSSLLTVPHVVQQYG